jgi:hypothetical protein
MLALVTHVIILVNIYKKYLLGTAIPDAFWSISFFVPVSDVFFDGSLWCAFGLGTVCDKKNFVPSPPP